MIATETSTELAGIQTIPTGGKGEPYLASTTTAQYFRVWYEDGSKARKDVTLWRPVTPDPNLFIIGDYAQGNYRTPIGSALLVEAVNDDSKSPLLKKPEGWSQVWNDRHSHCSRDMAIWAPIAPEGYIGLGHVGMPGLYATPEIPNYRCVRRDLVEITPVGNLIWDDKHSHASQNVEIFAIQGVPNAFLSQGNYEPPTFTAYRLKKAI